MLNHKNSDSICQLVVEDWTTTRMLMLNDHINFIHPNLGDLKMNSVVILATDEDCMFREWNLTHRISTIHTNWKIIRRMHTWWRGWAGRWNMSWEHRWRCGWLCWMSWECRFRWACRCDHRWWCRWADWWACRWSHRRACSWASIAGVWTSLPNFGIRTLFWVSIQICNSSPSNWNLYKESLHLSHFLHVWGQCFATFSSSQPLFFSSHPHPT